MRKLHAAKPFPGWRTMTGTQPRDLAAEFRAILAAGFKQADALTELHKADPETKSRRRYITAARREYATDETEIDAKPLLSVGDGGAWVSAWVWVSDHDAAAK